MLKEMKQYLEKVNNQQSFFDQLLNQLRQKIQSQIVNQVKKKFQKFKNKFNQQKENLHKEKQTLQYYINKQELNLSQQSSLKQDLSPLFKKINEKFKANEKMAHSFQFQINYPFNSKIFVQNTLLEYKTQILQNQLSQVKKILFYNTSIKKYMHKELQQIKTIHQKYQQIFRNLAQKTYLPLLKLKCSVQEASSNLLAYKNIEQVDLSIKQLSGILNLNKYKMLEKGVYKHHNILKKLTLRLSDMEFNQQKCDILKKLVKECKHLSNVKIQNYYKQCKLGLFQDFNWFPLKKQTHITGIIW